SASGRGERLGEGLGTAPGPSRAGAEIVGAGPRDGSGPFEVPADGTHSARPGPRTGRGGATRGTRKAIPSGGGAARTDRPVRVGRAGSRRGAVGASPARSSNGPAGRSRPARAVTGRSRSAPTAPPDLHGDELLMTSRGRLGENASGQGPDGV